MTSAATPGGDPGAALRGDPGAAPRASRACDHGAGWHEGTEPFFASAPAASRAWLLIEHPGPWPRQPAEAWLPQPLRAAVAAATGLGIRIQLIRRPGRRARHTDPLPVPIGVYLGWCAGPRPWLARGTVADGGDLAGLDLAGLARGRPGGFGDPVAGPLLLVCTHGRRNVCCARLGRPIAAALSRSYGAAVWETTHVGGDRHAANLVILPHGLYYGPVDVPSAQAAIEAYRHGEVTLDRFRGRAGQSERAQAAEHRIRRRTGLRGIDGVPAGPPCPPGQPCRPGPAGP